jgi:hypothetical protein
MLRERAAGGKSLAMDNPPLTGKGHIKKTKKTAPKCNLTFRKNCLDKWVHLKALLGKP